MSDEMAGRMVPGAWTCLAPQPGARAEQPGNSGRPDDPADDPVPRGAVQAPQGTAYAGQMPGGYLPGAVVFARPEHQDRTT